VVAIVPAKLHPKGDGAVGPWPASRGRGVLAPTNFDIWLTAGLAELLGRYPLFDLGVESAIRHNVLGGFWFATSVFVFWMQGAKPGQQEVRRRIFTIIFGSVLGILLTIPAGTAVSWPPPSRYPGLAHLYPRYLAPNLNNNSFPSQSTALYAAVTAGIYTLNKKVGSILWVCVGTLVALPRIYVGGHYPSDVLAGLILGLAGYVSAQYLLEPRLVSNIEQVFEKRNHLRIVRNVVVFVWILQVAVEFRDIIWLKNSLEYVLK